MLSRVLPVALCATLLAANVGRAETKVVVKNVHLCCGACLTAVGKILKEVDGVQGVSDQKNKTVTITARDDGAAQKALDALAAGGFHGNTGDAKLAMKAVTDAPAGKVTSLTLTGIHNCCGQCNNAIKATLGKVKGVTGNTAKPRSDTLEVTGDFEAGEVVKALEAAGFHVQVKK